MILHNHVTHIRIIHYILVEHKHWYAWTCKTYVPDGLVGAVPICEPESTDFYSILLCVWTPNFISGCEKKTPARTLLHVADSMETSPIYLKRQIGRWDSAREVRFWIERSFNFSKSWIFHKKHTCRLYAQELHILSIVGPFTTSKRIFPGARGQTEADLRKLLFWEF